MSVHEAKRTFAESFAVTVAVTTGVSLDQRVPPHTASEAQVGAAGQRSSFTGKADASSHGEGAAGIWGGVRVSVRSIAVLGAELSLHGGLRGKLLHRQ